MAQNEAPGEQPHNPAPKRRRLPTLAHVDTEVSGSERSSPVVRGRREELRLVARSIADARQRMLARLGRAYTEAREPTASARRSKETTRESKGITFEDLAPGNMPQWAQLELTRRRSSCGP